MPTNLILDIFS